jgi:O-antigen ligase
MSRFTLARLSIEGYPNTLIYVGLSLIGVLLSAYGLLRKYKDILQKRNILFLMFFVVIALSSIWNYRYDFFGNIKVIMILFTQFILFYSVSLFLTKEQFRGCLKRLFLVISLPWILASAASLVLYLLNIKYLIHYIDDRTIRQGFVHGRLFGLFSDPNFAAFTSLLIGFGLVYILMDVKKQIFRCFIYASILINMLYMIMSNSRTVLIAAVAAIIIFVLLHTKRKEGHLTKKRIISKTLLTILVMLAVYFASLGIMTLSGCLINPNRSTDELVRDDMDLDNISNNRFTIWENYLNLFMNKPLLGTSPRGTFPYAEEIDPDGFLFETQYEVHNGYLSLLVTTGIIGFIVMVLLFIRHIIPIKKLIQSNHSLNSENILCITYLVMILIFTFFFTNIFFTNNIETMLFWLCLGFVQPSLLISSHER